MSNGPQMFRINLENGKIRELRELKEVDFANLGLKEQQDIQEWIADYPNILGDGLLIIGKEFGGFEGTQERPDLLAVDTDGKLVVIELKRDDSGEDVHWQAIKYASYFSDAEVEKIVGILARYKGISSSEAETILLQHLNAENAEGLNELNHDQRIILASHRFAPEVASAVLWLNEKAFNKNLITCVQLTPYKDAEANSLYLQASTIIPVPGIDIVGVGINIQEGGGGKPNANDHVTHFMREVERCVKNELSDRNKPDRTSPWAGQFTEGGVARRYYSFAYSRSPWRLNFRYYEVDLFRPGTLLPGKWKARVFFQFNPNVGEVNFNFQNILDDATSYPDEWQVSNLNNYDYDRLFIGDIESESVVGLESENDALNDDFARKIADGLKELIETITPVVDRLHDGEA